MKKDKKMDAAVIAAAEALNKQGIRLHQALSMAMDEKLKKDVPLNKGK
jgi:hypothetical protein